MDCSSGGWRTRTRFWITPVAAILIAWIGLAPTARAQTGGLAPGAPVLQEAAKPTAAVRDSLARGVELERQRRWRDAIVLYEAELERLPNNAEIRQRLALVKAHADLERRYSDKSFSHSLRTLSDRQALDLYAEILVKIQTHYVEEPDWARLVDFGAYQLQVGMLDESFLRFSPEAARAPQADRIAAARELRVRLQSMRIADRKTARDAAWFAAQSAKRLGVPPTSTILEFVCGATAALDRYSSFLTEAQLRDVYSQIEGAFVGLGVELKSEKQSLLIVDVIPGGPAEQAGVRKGDRIVEVDAASLSKISPDKAADMLRGPEGSQVEVLLVTSLGSARRLKMTRRHVEVPSVVDVDVIDKELGVGYVRVTSFQKTTTRDMDAALWKLHRQGMKALLIDLRGNPGGLLNSAVEMADRFIDKGALLSTRGRSAREDFDYHARVEGTWRVPIAVLIDHDSASASEIFAGAIHDHRRGLIVGQRSYGKGSVQGIFELNLANVGVRLTTAKFYSPSGRAISHQGVAPDISVEPRVAGRPTAVDDAKLALATRADARPRDAAIQAALDAIRGERQARR